MYKTFEKWINDISNQTLPSNIKAIIFHLYEHENDNWSLELAGTKSFDENDEDWACDEVFDTRKNPLIWEQKASWENILAHVADIVKKYLENGKYKEKLKAYQAIGVGFVDGDIEIIYQNGNCANTSSAKENKGDKTQKNERANYKLSFDRDIAVKKDKNGKKAIFAEKSNLDEIEYKNIKKGWFCHVISSKEKIYNWPNVEFIYDSKKGDVKSDYLNNIHDWPIVKRSVMELFDKNGIKGIQYFPITLIDLETNEKMDDYVVMYIENFIEAYDLSKSKYTYYKEYDAYFFLPHEIYFDKEVCAKYDIFRCIKDTQLIYVSEKFVSIIEDNQLSGFEFF